MRILDRGNYDFMLSYWIICVLKRWNKFRLSKREIHRIIEAEDIRHMEIFFNDRLK